MEIRQITSGQIAAFAAMLRAAERSRGTIEKYTRDIRAFAAWLGGGKSRVSAAPHGSRRYRSGTTPPHSQRHADCAQPVFRLPGLAGLPVKLLKVQRALFRSAEKDLSREEYLRLIETAQAEGKERLALLMETICATGIRVSEVQYITVEAARQGRAEISLKGKIRTILLPVSCAASCSSTPNDKKPLLAKSFSPETVQVCRAGRSGRR